MEGKDWFLVFLTSLACLVAGIILIPLVGAILDVYAGLTLTVPSVVLIEFVVLFSIIAIHSSALSGRKKTIITVKSSSDVVNEIKEQFAELKGK
jgi:hypothetical protein